MEEEEEEKEIKEEIEIVEEEMECRGERGHV